MWEQPPFEIEATSKSEAQTQGAYHLKSQIRLNQTSSDLACHPCLHSSKQERKMRNFDSTQLHLTTLEHTSSAKRLQCRLLGLAAVSKHNLALDLALTLLVPTCAKSGPNSCQSSRRNMESQTFFQGVLATNLPLTYLATYLPLTYH